jgi:P-type E1-E2 ATPase
LVLVGSRRFMEMEGMAVPAALEVVQEDCHVQGHSLVFVAVGEQVAGAIELQPTLRPEAQQAIAALRKRGLALYIISGDHAAPTQTLAQTLGIEHYFAGVLPQDKADLVELLKAEGRTVCFVGDGINDGLALGKADVSVSLRGASTLATDTAQVVLMSQDLRQLEFLLQLAGEFDQSLHRLFRVTLIPVGLVVTSTFLFHTGIYISVLLWQLGMLCGIGMGFLPLFKHSAKPGLANKTQ